MCSKASRDALSGAEVSILGVILLLMLVSAIMQGCSEHDTERFLCRRGQQAQAAIDRCSEIRSCVVDLYEVERMQRDLSYCRKSGVE
jgi:hypothetical protein